MGRLWLDGATVRQLGHQVVDAIADRLVRPWDATPIVVRHHNVSWERCEHCGRTRRSDEYVHVEITRPPGLLGAVGERPLVVGHAGIEKARRTPQLHRHTHAASRAPCAGTVGRERAGDGRFNAARNRARGGAWNVPGTDRVTVETEGGKRRTFRIVGEDQADPAKGMVPYVAPIATALLGKSVGDTVEVMHGEAEIVAIE